jgi:hypothetical protein
VSIAFALGWQMAELYRPDTRDGADTAGKDDLPGLGSLTAPQMATVGVHQVEAALAKLADPIKSAGQDLARTKAALDGVEKATVGPDRHAQVLALHVQLLATLTAADFRLGKAYGLGRALADTCRNPETADDLRREFEPERVANLCGWLADLSSTFPPHAGHSVRESLERWCKRLAADPSAVCVHLSSILPRLRRQGTLWRALLSGEKLGRDMLELSHYLRAAESLIVRVRGLTGHFIRRFRLLVGGIALLFLGGLALMSLGHSGSITAGAGAIVAAIGLGWKAVGGALGRAVAKVEQPAWAAQLDVAVADAITNLPPELPAPPGTEQATKRKRVGRWLVGGAPADTPPPTW